MDRGAWWVIVHGVTRVRHDLATKPPPSYLALWEENYALRIWRSLEAFKNLRFELDLEGWAGITTWLIISKVEKSLLSLSTLNFFQALLARNGWRAWCKGAQDAWLWLCLQFVTPTKLCRGRDIDSNMNTSCFRLAWYCGLLLSSKNECVSHHVKVLSIRL